ncbi:response regulator receiver protein [Ferrimonas balearica DSM 9799]|uniref:Response regulator receiver protein n=1 Tax=Ferrimonas balearica (strain DSM 9799 / CCM 4581 / KCTC 23876 / PAT) TaxID=550540 RepID=E1SNF4_FERBD|nr:response regulator [Ferrimonas balearica]ADN75638.1 response regulator receiver protein [Ferrimonas balearica DSM 9799]MBY5979306.1 response regulator [Ferrimonas balearica]
MSKAPDYAHLRVLVADDAPPVQSFLRLMLRRQGFRDEHILLAKTGKECLRLAQEQTEPVDIVLCDFNFGEGLNGRQILEELRHQHWICDTTVFIVITGEAKGNVVHAMLDLKPDEYLLKPLNPEMLKQRIDRALRRRYALLPLHQAISAGQHEEAIRLCDELAVWHPQYLPVLRETQGRILRKLRFFSEAKVLYQCALEQSGADWARLGLANTHLDLGETEEALALLTPLIESRRVTIDALDCLSRYHLSSTKIPESIAHLQAAHRLAHDTSHREGLISDLCYCVDDAMGMVKAYDAFSAKCKGTYRDTVYTRVNRVRRLLMAHDLLPEPERPQCLQLITKLLGQIKAEDARGPVQLAKAHLLLLTGRIKEAVALTLALSRNGQLSHFYDFQHLAHLLLTLSFEADFRRAMEMARTALAQSTEEMMVEARAAMLAHLEARFHANMTALEQLYGQWQKVADGRDEQAKLQLLMAMHSLAPYLSPVCEKLLALLNEAWPRGMPRHQVLAIERQCQRVVEALAQRRAA